MLASETQQVGSPDTGQTTDTGAEADVLAESASVGRAEAEETRRVVPPRRKLSDEQEREVARLYAETSTPAPEIARRFGIAESSVYRVAQRHGAPRRGGPPASAQPEQEVSTVAAPPAVRQARPRRQARPTSSQAALAPAAAARRPRGAVRPGMRKAAGGGPRPFRIRFEVEEVLEAVDVRDALRQAEARGITEVTAVNPED